MSLTAHEHLCMPTCFVDLYRRGHTSLWNNLDRSGQALTGNFLIPKLVHFSLTANAGGPLHLRSFTVNGWVSTNSCQGVGRGPQGAGPGGEDSPINRCRRRHLRRALRRRNDATGSLPRPQWLRGAGTRFVAMRRLIHVLCQLLRYRSRNKLGCTLVPKTNLQPPSKGKRCAEDSRADAMVL